jgi:hypothetical protein
MSQTFCTHLPGFGAEVQELVADKSATMFGRDRMHALY